MWFAGSTRTVSVLERCPPAICSPPFVTHDPHHTALRPISGCYVRFAQFNKSAIDQRLTRATVTEDRNRRPIIRNGLEQPPSSIADLRTLAQRGEVVPVFGFSRDAVSCPAANAAHLFGPMAARGHSGISHHCANSSASTVGQLARSSRQTPLTSRYAIETFQPLRLCLRLRTITQLVLLSILPPRSIFCQTLTIQPAFSGRVPHRRT